MRFSTFSSMTALGAMLFLATSALAQPGPGMGMGHGRMGGLGPVVRCGMLLMHASPDVLKAKLGLNDQQVAKLQPIRNNVLSKHIGQRAQVQQLGLQLKTLLEADLPDQNKVLDVSRKIHNLRGQMNEERIKAQLQMLSVLSKDQRTKLRAECQSFGPGKGMGMGGGRGHGRGFGAGPGGPGGGW